MSSFTPLASLAGGALIGLSASLLLLFEGRVAGISGIVAGAFTRAPEARNWRLAFLAGLVVTGIVLARFGTRFVHGEVPRPMALVVAGGLLVGFGTRLGSGCTSGHGVCGISRFSLRSIVATMTFMATGVATAIALHGILGGAS